MMRAREADAWRDAVSPSSEMVREADLMRIHEQGMPLGKFEHMGLYALSLIGAGSFGLWQGSLASGLWMHILFVLIHLI